MGQSVKAGDLLAELDTGDLDFQIAMQEIEVEKTRLNLNQVRSANADYNVVRRAQLDLQQQEMRLEKLEKQLEAARIVAPFDGEVTYIISTSVGEYIAAFQIVAKVADITQLVLVTTSDKASELPLGGEVVLEFQKKEYRGEIVANPSSLFNDPDERLRKAAIIELPDGLPDKAAMGSDFRITYVQDSREDVIILPRKQINLMSGRRYVNVLVDGIRTEKDVEIGLMTDTDAEIVKGLDEGDMVIVN
jgi:multidrug efflux pump subunit AcrA (membrane-fusion protein)